jgi:hypothetical protein
MPHWIPFPSNSSETPTTSETSTVAASASLVSIGTPVKASVFGEVQGDDPTGGDGRKQLTVESLPVVTTEYDGVSFLGTPSTVSANMFPATTLSVDDYASTGTTTVFAWTSGGASVGSDLPYYTLVDSDVGNAISCSVTISDASSSAEATVSFGTCIENSNSYRATLIDDAETDAMDISTSGGYRTFTPWYGDTPTTTGISLLSKRKLINDAAGTLAFATDADFLDSGIPVAPWAACWHEPSKAWVAAPYVGNQGSNAGRPQFGIKDATAQVRSGDALPASLNNTDGWSFLFLSSYDSASNAVDDWPDYTTGAIEQSAGGMPEWPDLTVPPDIGSGARSTLEPIAWFVDPPYKHVENSDVIGVVADHYNGIEKVEFYESSENRTISLYRHGYNECPRMGRVSVPSLIGRGRQRAGCRSKSNRVPQDRWKASSTSRHYFRCLGERN